MTDFLLRWVLPWCIGIMVGLMLFAFVAGDCMVKPMTYAEFQRIW